MTEDPNPTEDEDWTLNEDKTEKPAADEPLEGDVEQEVLNKDDENYEGGDAGGGLRATAGEKYSAFKEQTTKRDFLKGLGAGAIGIGLLGAGTYAASETLEGDGELLPGGGDGTYTVAGEVDVNPDTLSGLYEESGVTMGVQEDGDLVAWNTNVVDSDGMNPLWRFSNEQFPDPQHFDVEGTHPVTEIYEASDAEVESMTEEMVTTFYSGEEGGSWQDESQYKEVGFQELQDGLTEYGNAGQAQDYFFNRQQTLESGEPRLENEWQQLLSDAR